MSTDHTVTVEWDQSFGVSYMFACRAPENGLCHAVYACGCEAWSNDGVEDGRPWHALDSGGPVDERHYGTFDATLCNLRDWFENSDECLAGEVTFPVTAEFDGDYYTFLAVDERTDVHPDQGSLVLDEPPAADPS